jgi:hypothetical protein
LNVLKIFQRPEATLRMPRHQSIEALLKDADAAIYPKKKKSVHHPRTAVYQPKM